MGRLLYGGRLMENLIGQEVWMLTASEPDMKDLEGVYASRDNKIYVKQTVTCPACGCEYGRTITADIVNIKVETW